METGYVSGYNEFLERMSSVIPPFEIDFFLQICESGISNNVPFVRLHNGDVLLGHSNWQETYYSDIFANHEETFLKIGLKKEAFGAAFDALISYHYENCDSMFFRKSSFIKKEAVVLDVGVRIGHFVVKAARGVGDVGRVVAIDATDLSEKYTRLHIDENGLKNVQFVKAVVGDEDQKITTFFYGSPNESFSGIFEETVNEKGNVIIDRNHHVGSYQTEMTTIDTILDKIGLQRCDLVILQINGAETLAVKGMERVLSRYKPILFITSFQSSDITKNSSRIVADYLRESKYRLICRQATGFVYKPIY